MIDEAEVVRRLLASPGHQLLACSASGFVGEGERDVVILDKRRATLLVLEVKAWGCAALEGTFKSENEWDVAGLGRKRSPIKQAQDGALALVDRLPWDLKPGKRYTWMVGAVFTSLSHADARRLGLFNDARLLSDGHPCLFLDDLESGNVAAALGSQVDASLRARGWKERSMTGRLAARVWQKISPDANAAPEHRHRSMTLASAEGDLEPHMTSVLTRTRSGLHRVNGVVGSGKTLFLSQKAVRLAQQHATTQGGLFTPPSAPILVLTFTVSAASKVRDDIEKIVEAHFPDLRGRWRSFIDVHHFDELLRVHYGYASVGERSYAPFLATATPKARYATILFDEVQDAQPGWGSFIARNLDVTARDPLLLLTFDPAQGTATTNLAAIFEEIRMASAPDMDARWTSRNFYLRTSHRVPQVIGRFAMKGHTAFTSQDFTDADPSDAGAAQLAGVIHRALSPRFASPGGDLCFRRASAASADDEVIALVEAIEEILANSNASVCDIAIAVPPNDDYAALRQAIANGLDAFELDTFVLEAANRSRFFDRGDRVTIGTPIRLKGLELPIVIIPPSLLKYLDEPNRRRDGFYQAVTRATSQVVIVGSGARFDELEMFARQPARV